MSIFEIRPTGEGKRCLLSGPLGIFDRLEIYTIRWAAPHAQFCVRTSEAILRTFNVDGGAGQTADSTPEQRPRSRDNDQTGGYF